MQYNNTCVPPLLCNTESWSYFCVPSCDRVLRIANEPKATSELFLNNHCVHRHRHTLTHRRCGSCAISYNLFVACKRKHSYTTHSHRLVHRLRTQLQQIKRKRWDRNADTTLFALICNKFETVLSQIEAEYCPSMRMQILIFGFATVGDKLNIWNGFKCIDCEYKTWLSRAQHPTASMTRANTKKKHTMYVFAVETIFFLWDWMC